MLYTISLAHDVLVVTTPELTAMTDAYKRQLLFDQYPGTPAARAVAALAARVAP